MLWRNTGAPYTDIVWPRRADWRSAVFQRKETNLRFVRWLASVEAARGWRSWPDCIRPCCCHQKPTSEIRWRRIVANFGQMRWVGWDFLRWLGFQVRRTHVGQAAFNRRRWCSWATPVIVRNAAGREEASHTTHESCLFGCGWFIACHTLVRLQQLINYSHVCLYISSFSFSLLANTCINY